MNTKEKEVVNEILGYNFLDKQIAKLSNNEISEIRKRLNEELLLNLTTEQFANSSDLYLSEFIENNLKISRDSKNILHVFGAVEKIASEELHTSINFHWFARWDDFLNVGNFLTRPDSLDFVEVIMRIEEELNLKITNNEASQLETIGDTIRYIWKRLEDI